MGSGGANSRMIRWRIYYGDGTTYDCETGSAWNAPGLGVQVCMHDSAEHGRFSQARYDYYVWYGDRWVGVDLFGLWDYLQQSGPRKVLFGRTIPSVDYDRIRRWADADPFFDERTAWMPNER